MRVYKGERIGNFATSVKVYEDGEFIRNLDPRNDLVNHSPDGFEWGYEGSGPSQLALAMLSDLYKDEIVLKYYQKFKFDVIALLRREDNWQITSGQIEDWMTEAESVKG